MNAVPTRSMERSIRVAVLGAALVPAAILAGAGGFLAYHQISAQEIARRSQLADSISSALGNELARVAERSGALSLDSDLARAIQVPVFISQADSRLEQFSRDNREVTATAVLAPDLQWITSFPPSREAGMLSGGDELLKGCAIAARQKSAGFFPLSHDLGLYLPIRRELRAFTDPHDSFSGALCLEVSWQGLVARALPSDFSRIAEIRWDGRVVYGAMADSPGMTLLSTALRDTSPLFGPRGAPELRIDAGPGALDERLRGRILGLALALVSVLGLIGWGAVRLARDVVDPIRRSTELVRRFARGDYRYRPDPASFIEVNELADTLGRMGEMILAQIEREKESNRAELDALKNQLKPHFLFNSLHGIASSARLDPPRAIPLIQRLADLYRRILDCSKRVQQPIADELALVENYLSLEKERFGERLRYAIELSEVVAGFPVPCLLIQTLVENCVKHGVAKSIEGGEIRVIAEPVEPGRARIVIENTGEELAPRFLPGTGLANTLRRLELANAGKHEFRLERKADGRTRASFLLQSGVPGGE